MKPLAVMVVAAMIATAAGTIGSKHRNDFSEPLGLRGSMAGPGQDPAEDEATLAKQQLRNTLLVDSLIGASVAAILAVAAATLYGRPLIAGAAGLLLGGLAGAAGAFLGLLIHNKVDFDQLPPMVAVMQTPLVHVVLWIMTGAALAIAIGLSTQRQSIIPLLGQFAVYALIAAAIYPPVAGLVFPLLNSDQPIPEGLANTALWIAIPTLLFAFAITRTLRTAPGNAPTAPGELPAAAGRA